MDNLAHARLIRPWRRWKRALRPVAAAFTTLALFLAWHVLVFHRAFVHNVLRGARRYHELEGFRVRVDEYRNWERPRGIRGECFEQMAIYASGYVQLGASLSTSDVLARFGTPDSAISGPGYSEYDYYYNSLGTRDAVVLARFDANGVLQSIYFDNRSNVPAVSQLPKPASRPVSRQPSTSDTDTGSGPR